jgi:uncharacterized protein YuzE
MKKIHYSPDVDGLLIPIGKENIAYAEDLDNVIIHYSETDQIVLIEILDFKQSMTPESLNAIVAAA